MKKILGFLFAIVLVVVVFFSDSVTCPVCYASNCYFTGNTQVVYGALMMEYYCGAGHRFYVRSR